MSNPLPDHIEWDGVVRCLNCGDNEPTYHLLDVEWDVEDFVDDHADCTEETKENTDV